MNAHDMDPLYASHETPRLKLGFAARADEPDFEFDEADDFGAPGEVREPLDGLSWLGVAVTAAAALAIGVAIGVWTGPMLRPAHRPAAEPIATVARRAEAPVQLRADELTAVATTPPETAPDQPLDASTSAKRHHSHRKTALAAAPAPAPRPSVAAKPVASTARLDADRPSPIDELLTRAYEAPH
jgi:hypothetical protein